MPKQPVKLHAGKANPEHQKLSKNNHDEAEWSSDDDPYTVEFGSDNPFVNGPTFHVHPGTPTSSGPIKGDALGIKEYSVAKFGAAGGSDPDVEITP